MPLVITIVFAKLSLYASRIVARGGGSALPGVVAEKLDPRVARKLRRNFDSVVLITGTNGKTTATKMVVEILRADGRQVLTNASGSNLKRGVVAKLLEASSWRGHIVADTAVFEVDEASLPAVAAELAPTHLAVLNLFRDQLDRYGELETTANLIRPVLQRASKAQVYLNADDPLVASLGEEIPAGQLHYFGIEASDTRRLSHDATADSAHSPHDGSALIYSENWFGHLGHYHSSDGSFKRPKPEVRLKQQGSTLQLALAGEDYHAMSLPLPGLYNAYNALAAAALAADLGVSGESIRGTLAGTTAAFGRVEQFEYQGRQVSLLLIKNPTGFNQVIQTFLTGDNDKRSIMLAINDNFADGRDVSWLWDAAVEEIGAARGIVASGLRAADMALRLKYANRAARVEPDLQQAFVQEVAAVPEGGQVYVLPTYTAMMALRRWLQSSANLRGFWHE